MNKLHRKRISSGTLSDPFVIDTIFLVRIDNNVKSKVYLIL